MGWFVFEGLINALEISVTLYLAESLFYRKRAKPVSMIWRFATVVLGVALLLLCAYGNIDIPDILPGILLFFLYSVYLLHADVLPSLMWSCINCAIQGVCVFCCISLLGMLIKTNDIEIFFTENTHRVLFLAIVQTTRISITVLLAKWFGRRKSSFLLRKGWWLFVGIPLYSIYTLFMFAEYEGIGFNGITPTYVNISIFVGLLVINVGLLFFFEEISRAIEEALLTKARNDALTMQLRHQEEVRQMVKESRKDRHDFNNHIYTLRGLSSMKKYDELDAYLQQMTDHIAIQKVRFYSENSAVDALLNTKINLAESKGIEVSAHADLPQDLLLTDEKLCVLLGNLLNNAYDACMRMHSGKRRIEVEIFMQKGKLVILCINTTDGKEMRRGNRWLSLKPNPLEHGYGLQSIDDIVAEYNGYCKREHADGRFTCSIVF